MLNTFENVPLPNMTIDNQYIYIPTHTHIYIYRVFQKKLCFTFMLISQLILVVVVIIFIHDRK